MKNKLNILAIIFTLGFCTSLYSMMDMRSSSDEDKYEVNDYYRCVTFPNNGAILPDNNPSDKSKRLTKGIAWAKKEVEKARLKEAKKLKASIISSLKKIHRNIENLYFNNPSKMSEEYIEELIRQKLEIIKKSLTHLVGLDLLLNETCPLISSNFSVSINNIYVRVLELKINFVENRIDLLCGIIDDLYRIIIEMKAQNIL